MWLRPSGAAKVAPDGFEQGGAIRVRRPLVALLAAAPVAALPLPVQGPLEVRTPGSLRDLFLDVVQWDARAVTAPRLEVGWATCWGQGRARSGIPNRSWYFARSACSAWLSPSFS